MPERQMHGFIYENNVIEKFNLIKEDNYTAIWDAKTKNNIPVSIKYEKFGSDVELADLFRNETERNEDFYMIVGFWKDDKNYVIEEHILYIPIKDWKEMFNLSLTPSFKKLLAIVSNKKEDDLTWKLGCNLLKEKWIQTTNNLIRLRFKRDHKIQKRMQCAINNKDFYNYFCKKYEVIKSGS